MTHNEVALQFCERWQKTQRGAGSVDEIAAFMSGVKAALVKEPSDAGRRDEIVAGAFYKTRGDKHNLSHIVGPLEHADDGDAPWRADVYGNIWKWGYDGLANADGTPHNRDLVERVYRPSIASSALDPGTVERCAKIADDYAAPNRFKVSDQWKEDMSPADVYDTAATDVGVWIANEIRALIGQPSDSCAGKANAADEDRPQKDRYFVVYEGWVEGDECTFARACYAQGIGDYGIVAALRAFRRYNKARALIGQPSGSAREAP